MLTKDQIDIAFKKHIMKLRYETRDGCTCFGETVSSMPALLRSAGWKNVSRLDKHDFKKMGCEVVEAQYVGGARKTGRFVPVVVWYWPPNFLEMRRL